MKSPRFPLREPTLKPLFDRGNLRRVWEKKVRNAMRQQFLPDPVDHIDFHQTLSAQCHRLESLVISGTYSPSQTRRILQEKSKGLCRQLVIPHVDDALILQCLSDAMYRDIKNKEPTTKAFFEPGDHHFSKHKTVFKEHEYGSFKAWLNFQKEIFRFSKTREYIIVTDIANYYDTISYTHLRNIISDISPNVREPVLDMLIFVLSGLLWQPDYMPRIEVGLPQINVDAPRILAHCFLYELDSYLEKSHGNDFVRFMDDIDIGVDTLAEARSALKCVDLVLQTRHVRLNSGKTLILKREDALAHFRVRQNHLLDLVESRIEAKVAKGVTVERERKAIVNSLENLWRAGSFDTGNGEKILKRMLGISKRIGAAVQDNFLYEILMRRPASRVAALGSIATLPLTNSRARLLLTVIRDPQIVDDATFIHISQYIVETRVETRRTLDKLLSGISHSMPQGFFGLYAAVWILSKYGTNRELLNFLMATLSHWQRDPWLGRLVGGMYPIFIKSRSEARFRSLVLNSGNPSAISVYEFHDDLRRDPKAFDMSFNFIKAPNPSKATGISHSKYLLLLSALANTKAPLAKRQTLIANQFKAWGDIYYLQRASRVSGMAIAPTVLPKTPVP